MNRKFLPLLVSVLLLTLMCQQSFAQKAFEQKNVLINGGVMLYSGVAHAAVSAEYGITDQIGAGIRSHFSSSSNGYDIVNGAIYANYHFAESARIDPFAGLMLDKTYYVNRAIDIKSSQPINLNVQVGGRYLFTKRFGAYGQAILPFSKAVPFGGELGLTLKL
jgi:hypothetical protein